MIIGHARKYGKQLQKKLIINPLSTIVKLIILEEKK